MAFITGYFGSSKSLMKLFMSQYSPIRLTQVLAFVIGMRFPIIENTTKDFRPNIEKFSKYGRDFTSKKCFPGAGHEGFFCTCQRHFACPQT